MQLSRSTRRAALAGAALAAAVAACGDDGRGLINPVDLAPVTFFRSTLNGANERPTPVATAATGEATMTVRRDSIYYTVRVFDISAVTAAHIHRGGPDVADAIMVDLFLGPTTSPNYSGVLASGVITRSSTFRATFTFDSVLTRMRAGTSYVNVHTTQRTAGEIRGQVVVAPVE